MRSPPRVFSGVPLLTMQRIQTKTNGSLPQSSARPNTVNLRGPALAMFLDKLDDPEKAVGVSKRRGFSRRPFRREAVEVVLVHPGGTDMLVKVACRNLSTGGISVLHNSFVHPGSQCVTRLPKPDGTVISVPGAVKRCIHRAGVIHEVGIAFSRPINAKEFAAADPFTTYFSREAVNPMDLRGTLLVVEPSQTTRGIIRHYLRDTGLIIEEVTTAAWATVIACSCDIVLANGDLPDAQPADFARAIRDAGFGGGLVFTAADTSATTRMRIMPARPTVVLAEPLSQLQMLRAFAEVLLDGRSRADGATSVARVKSDLGVACEGLRKAMASGSCIHCGRALKRIGDLSERAGWSSVLKMARQLSSELQAKPAVDVHTANLDALVHASLMQAAS